MCEGKVAFHAEVKFVEDSAALACDTLVYSGGKIGYQVETSLADLQKAVKVTTGDLTV